jgi:hypothetical protein
MRIVEGLLVVAFLVAAGLAIEIVLVTAEVERIVHEVERPVRVEDDAPANMGSLQTMPTRLRSTPSCRPIVWGVRSGHSRSRQGDLCSPR